MNDILNDIESGKVKIVSSDDNWQVNEEAKKAILELFSKNQMKEFNAQDLLWKDKIDWLICDEGESAAAKKWQRDQFRICPGAWVRRGVFIGGKVVIMPSFVNVGAYIGSGSMIDSGATVGSCAYVGDNCHISANVVLAGVLEPIQARPVIIENDCFISSQCLVAEGMHVGKGCVFGAGVVLTKSTRVYDRNTGKYTVGERIPEGSVLVPGSYLTDNGLSIACVIKIKTVDPEIKKKLSLNEILREGIGR